MLNLRHSISSISVATVVSILTIPVSVSVHAASNILTMKLEHTTNDHSLTLPKIAYTRVFDDTSSLMLEKSWYWQKDFHDSGWPKHDEAFINYSLPAFNFGEQDRWSIRPQAGAKFRSNVTRALAAVRVGYQGDGWGLATRYRYEKDTENSGAEKAEVGRIDVYASYDVNDNLSLLYNPHYHFKQENKSSDFGTGDRDYLEQEFLVFYKLDPASTVFSGFIQRDKNSQHASVDPGQRNSSWLIGYQYKF